MANTRLTIKRNDLEPSLQLTVSNADGTPFDFSNGGGTPWTMIRFLMREKDTQDLKIDSGTGAAIVDAANGVLRYEWQPGDTDGKRVDGGDLVAEGIVYEAEFELNNPTSRKQSFPTAGFLTITVKPDIPNVSEGTA